MDHVLPDFQGAVHAVGPGLVIEFDRVVQQDLIPTDVDQERGQRAQIGEVGRGVGIGGVLALEIQLDHFADIRSDHGICLSPGLIGLVGARHVGPGADTHRSCGQRQLLVTGCHQGGCGQPAACGISGNGQIVWRKTVIEQPAVGGHPVFDSGRKRLFGPQPIIEHEHCGLSRAGHLATERTMGVERAHHIPAAVQIQNGPLGLDARRPQPFGRPAGYRQRFDANIVGHPKGDFFHARPALVQADRGTRCGRIFLAQNTFQLDNLWSGHVQSLLTLHDSRLSYAILKRGESRADPHALSGAPAQSLPSVVSTSIGTRSPTTSCMAAVMWRASHSAARSASDSGASATISS